MSLKTISEAQATIRAPENLVRKKMPVFYNPVMSFNRDMSILLLKARGEKDMKIGLPLAGSGVRGIRMLLELPGQIQYLFMNDINPDFLKIAKQNMKLSSIKAEKISYASFLKDRQKVELNAEMKKVFRTYNGKVVLANTEANIFMLCTPGFDYIDIDPFGSPNPFLDSACMRLARGGILAVTATDTGALCGTYVNACRRKYWAMPLHNEIMHETGIRILIRRVQLISAQYDKALIPVFSYDKEHYIRVFFECRKGKKEVDEMLKGHKEFSWRGQIAGPLWTGQLWDGKLLQKMVRLEKDLKNIAFLQLLSEEEKIGQVGFYDIHTLCKKNGHKIIPSFEELYTALDRKGIKHSRTHFCPTGIRAAVDEKMLISILEGITAVKR